MTQRYRHRLYGKKSKHPSARERRSSGGDLPSRELSNAPVSGPRQVEERQVEERQVALAIRDKQKPHCPLIPLRRNLHNKARCFSATSLYHLPGNTSKCHMLYQAAASHFGSMRHPRQVESSCRKPSQIGRPGLPRRILNGWAHFSASNR
jgi:hypothetical protein